MNKASYVIMPKIQVLSEQFTNPYIIKAVSSIRHYYIKVEDLMDKPELNNLMLENLIKKLFLSEIPNILRHTFSSSVNNAVLVEAFYSALQADEMPNKTQRNNANTKEQQNFDDFIQSNAFDKLWKLTKVIDENTNDLQIKIDCNLHHLQRLVTTQSSFEKELSILVEAKKRESQGDTQIMEILKQQLEIAIPSPAIFLIHPKEKLLELTKESGSGGHIVSPQIVRRMAASHKNRYIDDYQRTVIISFLLFLQRLSETDDGVKHVLRQVFGGAKKINVENFHKWWGITHLKQSRNIKDLFELTQKKKFSHWKNWLLNS